MIHTFVTGPAGSGKSTYVNSTVTPNGAVLRIGEILRSIFGDSYRGRPGMSTDTSVEVLVRAMVQNTLVTCDKLQIPLVVDGFPRTIQQATFVGVLGLSIHGAINVIILSPPEGVLEARRYLRESDRPCVCDDRKCFAQICDVCKVVLGKHAVREINE